MDGTEFADIRWRLKLNQTALAGELGVHPVTVNKWEHGVRPVPRYIELAMRGLLCQQEHGRRKR